MLITDIQRFSVHDGPGIRTTVFLKGCNLSCRWCHNPETISPRPQLQVFPNRCIGCSACVKACPRGAHVEADGRRKFDRSRCAACGACSATCYAGVLTMVGREMSVESVLAEVLSDEEFYLSSGGGITLSGGEPLMQPQAVGELLAACKARGLHTAIETNLAYPWPLLEALLPNLDLVMADIKLMDQEAHHRWTGASNEQVLANALTLSRTPTPLIIRTPVIGGVNADILEIGAIADFVAGFRNLQYYELLAYHPLGTGKYQSLGLEYPACELAQPDRQVMSALADEARKRGIQVRTT